MTKTVLTFLFSLGLLFSVSVPNTDALSLSNQDVTASVSSFFSSFFSSLENFFAPLFYTEPTSLPPKTEYSPQGENPEPADHTPPQPTVIYRDTPPSTVTNYVSVPSLGITPLELSLALQSLKIEIQGQIPPQLPQSEVRGFSGDGLASSINQVITNITSGDTTGNYRGSFTGTTTSTVGLFLPSYTPVTTTDLLYNTSGDLYWQGNLLAGSAVGNWASNGTDVYRTSGKVGVGTASPASKLHVASGASGATPYAATLGTFETSGAGGYLSILTPNASYSGIAFGNPSSNIAGLISYNDVLADGFDFRTSAGQTAMTISSSQNVGIGLGSTAAQTKLEVANNGGNIAIFRNTNASSYGDIRIYNDQNSGSRALQMAYTGSSYGAYWGSGTSGEQGAIGTSGAYPLTFGTDNTQRMIINSSGNVGIGTSTPGSKLTVNGNISAIGGLGLSSSNPYLVFDDIGYSGNDYQIYGDSSGTLNFWNGTNKITLLSSGNVGIGTTNPGAKLDIAANTGAGDSTILQKYTWLADTTNWGMRLEQQYSLSPIRLQYNWIMKNGSGADINMMSFAGGNVGIGTTNPSETLEVASSGALPLSLYRTTNGTNHGTGIDFALNNGSDARAVYARIAASISDQTAGSEDGDLVFATTRAGATYTEGMRLTSTGKVGIGTNDPQGKLDVSGIADGGSVFFRSTGRPFLDIKGGVNSYKTLRFSNVGSDSDYRWDVNALPGNDATYPNALSFHNPTIAEAFTLQQSGLVSIKHTTTSGPLSLTIRNNNASSVSQAQVGIDVGFSDAHRVTVATGPDSGYGAPYDGSAYFLSQGNTNGIKFITADATPITFNPNASEAMRITSAGNVGIGTTSPYAKLSVQGSSDSVQFLAKGNATQNLDIFQIQDSSGNVSVGINGDSLKVFRPGVPSQYGQFSVNGGGLHVASSWGAGVNVEDSFNVAGVSTMTGTAAGGVLHLNGAAGQTADLLQINNSDAVRLAAITAAGDMMFDGDRDVVIQNAASGNPYSNHSRSITLQSQFAGNVTLKQGFTGQSISWNGEGLIWDQGPSASTILNVPTGNLQAQMLISGVGLGFYSDQFNIHDRGDAITTGLSLKKSSITALNSTDLSINSTAGDINLLPVGGNVGIGTSSPATTLSVAGSGYITGGLGIGTVNTSANSIGFNSSSVLTIGGGNGQINLGSGNYAGSAGTTIGSGNFINGGGFFVGKNNTCQPDCSGNSGFAVGENIISSGAYTYAFGKDMTASNWGMVLGMGKNSLFVDQYTTNPADHRYGNVGVGTSSPWATFSVDQSGIGNPGPRFVVGSPASTDLLVDSSGNVGIGTASPGYKLQVSDEALVDGQLISDNTGWWKGFKSNAGSGIFGFNQGDVFTAGIMGNVYAKGFSTNAIGIFNASTDAEDIVFYNKNDVIAGYMVLKANGNFGVGTADPLGKAHIVTTSDTTYLSTTAWDNKNFVVGAAGNTGGVSISYDQSANVGILAAVSPNVANRSLLLNPGGGTVGIGGYGITPSTFYTGGAVSGLKLQNRTTDGRSMLAIVPNGNSSLADLWLYQTSDTTTNYSGISMGYDLTDTSWGFNSMSAGTGTTRPIYFNATNGQNAASSNLYLATSGNVGIGTTNPSEKLQVTGNIVASGNVIAGDPAGQYAYMSYGSSKGQFNLVGGSTTWDFNQAILNIGSLVGTSVNGFANNVSGAGDGSLKWTNNGSWNFGITSDAGIVFNPGGSEAMRISSAGNVGIGTTTPFATLAVNPIAGGASNQFVVGSSTATSFIINNSGNVGIGTSNPDALLNLQGTTPTLQFGANAASDEVAIKYVPGDAEPMQFMLGGTTRFGIRVNGLLQIDSPAITFSGASNINYESGVIGMSRGANSAGNTRFNLGEPIGGAAQNMQFNTAYGSGPVTGSAYIFNIDPVSDPAPDLDEYKIASFRSGGVDKFVLTSSGKLGIGSSTPSARLSLTQGANTQAGGLWIAETGDTDYRSIFMNTSGVMSFQGGDIGGTLNTATLNAAGEWTNASDRNYKDNIETLHYGLSDLMKLNPRSYTMKNTDDQKIGFIAQEVELVIPEVVSGVEGSKGISYGNMVALLVKGIQELKGMFDSLADLITTKRVQTDTLCIGATCVTEDQLKAFLQNSGQPVTTYGPTGSGEEDLPAQAGQGGSEEEETASSTDDGSDSSLEGGVIPMTEDVTPSETPLPPQTENTENIEI